MSRESFEAAIAVLAGEPLREESKRTRDCQLCEDPKSVGKYYVDPSESENHGWWRVCEDCAEMVSRVGADVQYYKYSKVYKQQLSQKPELPEAMADCSHVWDKWSLVSEFDKYHDRIFDWMRCTRCGCYGKRFVPGQTEMVDLCEEIDLNCSR